MDTAPAVWHLDLGPCLPLIPRNLHHGIVVAVLALLVQQTVVTWEKPLAVAHHDDGLATEGARRGESRLNGSPSATVVLGHAPPNDGSPLGGEAALDLALLLEFLKLSP